MESSKQWKRACMTIEVSKALYPENVYPRYLLSK